VIGNERQLSAARRKIRDLERALSAASSDVDRETLKALAGDIKGEVDEYINIRDGVIRQFGVESLDDVGPAVVKARVARGWTQRRLADELGVSEQMVQKDEASLYENAGLARVAEVMDALQVELVGAVRDRAAPHVDVNAAQWSIQVQAVPWDSGLSSSGGSANIYTHANCIQATISAESSTGARLDTQNATGSLVLAVPS
jgi:transcriptional regulator with XRE-family HTH domain